MHRLHHRLRRLEEQADERDGPTGLGLAALLTWATRHPRAEDDDYDDEDEAPTGLTALLAEARQWIQQRDEDTPV